MYLRLNQFVNKKGLESKTFFLAESEGVEPMLSIACPIRDLFLKVANAPNNAPGKT